MTNLKVTTTKQTEYGRKTTITYIKATQEFLDCKDEVDKICKSIRRLLDSVDGILKELITSDPSGKLVEQYKYCLKHTITVALDDVDVFIDKYSISDETAVSLLRTPVVNLLDGVDELFNQG